jgi:replication initiation and membrane attachment protein DnaB
MGVEYILVPFSRRKTETENQLREESYIELPWSIESEIFISDNDIDRYLYNQIGAKKFNEMKRLVRKGQITPFRSI